MYPHLQGYERQLKSWSWLKVTQAHVWYRLLHTTDAHACALPAAFIFWTTFLVSPNDWRHWCHTVTQHQWPCLRVWEPCRHCLSLSLQGWLSGRVFWENDGFLSKSLLRQTSRTNSQLKCKQAAKNKRIQIRKQHRFTRGEKCSVRGMAGAQGQQRRARGTPHREGRRAVYSRGDAQQIVKDLGRQMIASSWGLEEAPRSPEQASCPLVLACRCFEDLAGCGLWGGPEWMMARLLHRI